MGTGVHRRPGVGWGMTTTKIAYVAEMKEGEAVRVKRRTPPRFVVLFLPARPARPVECVVVAKSSGD